MKAGNMDPPVPQQSPVERQFVIKTKVIGSAGGEVPAESFRAKLEAQAKARENINNEQADKARAEMLDRAGEMRHLKYEIIDEAAIVQVSVINTGDGTVVRKVPPDKVVGLVKHIREQKKTSHKKGKFDMKL